MEISKIEHKQRGNELRKKLEEDWVRLGAVLAAPNATDVEAIDQFIKLTRRFVEDHVDSLHVFEHKRRILI